DRVLEDETLQFDRKAADRRVDAAERLARFRPLALLRVGDRAPQLGVMLVADAWIAEVFQRIVGAPEHDIGDRAQHQAGRVVAGRMLVAERDVEYAFGLWIKIAREIEPRQLDAGGSALRLRRRRGGIDELGLAIAEIGLPIEAPELRIERERTVAADAFA